MSGVVVVACQVDLGDADLVAGVIRETSRRVDIFRIDEQVRLLDGPAEATDSSAGVVVIWSAAAAQSFALRSMASRAEAAGKLLWLQVDACPLPDTRAPSFDMSSGVDRLNRLEANTFLAALDRLSGRVKVRQRVARRRRLPLAIGGAIAIAAGAGLVMALANRAPQPADPGSAIAAAQAEDAARIDWNAIDTADISALRAYLRRHDETSRAAQARRAILALDRSAWASVEAAIGAEAKLEELANYRAYFPEGAFIAQVTEGEQSLRALVTDVQRLLTDAGLNPGAETGVCHPQTIAAVKRFQSAMGYAPTGLIDEALRQSLRARVGRR